jgi:hypothetical protein
MERAANPAVGWLAEKLGGDIDWEAVSSFLPPGKKLADMTPWELMRFLGTLDAEQLKKINADLPEYSEWGEIDLLAHKAGNAVLVGEYELALLTIPMIADRASDYFRRGIAYQRNARAGASTVVAGLQAVRTACSVVLTIGGGVAGRAYGLIGVSAGSAAGAGFSTLSQETAMGLAAGNFKPGSVLFKSGKDAAMAFIGSMIGGALASKFTTMLEGPMAKIIVNAKWREFVIGRIADVGSGLLTTPIDVVAQGMLDGEWPKNLDELLERVRDNAIRDVVLGAGVDVVTHMPNLKGKAWNELTDADFALVPEKAAIEGGRPAGPQMDPATAAKEAIEVAHARGEAKMAPGDATPASKADAPASGSASATDRPQMSTERPVSRTAAVVEGLDRRKPLGVSGDAGTVGRSQRRFGVFEAKVKTEDGRVVDCVVKIMPKKSQAHDFEPFDMLPHFQAEVEGAIAASRTGLAPEFLGVVDVQGGYGYAMSRVPGAFVHNESRARKGSAEWNKAEAEASLARDAVTRETAQDVRRFGEELYRLGYGYHEGEIQGLVGPDGRWRPIDFAGIRPLPTDPVEALNARQDHLNAVEREAQTMEANVKQRTPPADAGPQRTSDPKAGEPEVAVAGSDEATGKFDISNKNDFAAEEPTMPGGAPPQHSLKMSDRDLTDLVAETLKLPVSPFRETRFYGNYDDFAQTFKAKWPDLPVPIAYHDPATNILHIGPQANKTTLIHETVHRVAQDMNPQNRGLLGEYLNEGITEWVARNRLGREAASTAYNANVAFVEYLAGKVGRNTMENLMVHGSYGGFRTALYEALGQNRAALDEFFYIVRNMEAHDAGAGNIQRLKALLGD